MRVIRINPALNGWIVDVGCSTVVFTDKSFMLSELSRYFDKPEEVEKEYQVNAINKMTAQAETPELPTLREENPVPLGTERR